MGLEQAIPEGTMLPTRAWYPRVRGGQWARTHRAATTLLQCTPVSCKLSQALLIVRYGSLWFEHPLSVMLCQ